MPPVYSDHDIIDRLNLSVDLIPPGQLNRPGVPIAPDYVTIHDTGNEVPGADAVAHAGYLRSEAGASWHFTVDDRRSIRHLPLREKALHARRGNRRSIGLNVCMQRGVDQPATNARAALLTAVILHQIAQDVDRVVPHAHWSATARKPVFMRDWDGFLRMVDQRMALLPDGFNAGEALKILPGECGLAQTDEPDLDDAVVAAGVNRFLSN